MPELPSSPPPETAYPAKVAARAKVGIVYYLEAALGSVMIGVSLPCLLVSLRTIDKSQPIEIGSVFADVIGTLIVATIFCGPGAVVLSIILLKILAPRSVGWTLRQTMCAGVLAGVAMAFLNLPGYFVFEILKYDTFLVVRVALLFAVAGASCGLWIAWQAWRATRPQERFLPRFSLRTLLLLVFLWGAVMLAFQPRQHPVTPPPGADDMV